MYQENMNESLTLYGLADNFPLLMPRWGYAASAFMLFLIGFFGFFLNLMVILLMIKDRQLWTPLNIILFNLVCSDFSVSVLGNPFTLISALFYRWVFGKTMCVMYGFFMALLGITSITTLTVLAFERYMLVSQPLRSKQLTSKGAVICIAFIWSYSLVLTTPPLLGWGNYVHEAANISCSVNWHEQSTNTLTYILYLFVFGLIVPLVVISYSYYNIIRTMRQNALRLGRVSKAEAKVTSMVLVMIIAFIVAWTPYSIFALIEQFATKGIVSPGVGVIPALVAKSSICYDPLIYVGMNTQFRQSIKRVFGMRTLRGQSQTEKGYENTLISPMVRISRHDPSTKCNDVQVSQTKKLQNIILIENETRSYTNHIFNLNEQNEEAEDIEENTNATIDLKHFDNKINKTDCNPLDTKEMYYKESNDDNNSPILSIVDSKKFVYSKAPLLVNESDEKKISKNMYNNKAFDNHPENYKENEPKYKQIVKQSISLEPITIPNRIMTRKLSIDIKLDEHLDSSGTKSLAVFNKYKDTIVLKPKRNDYRTYLVIKGGDTDED